MDGGCVERRHAGGEKAGKLLVVRDSTWRTMMGFCSYRARRIRTLWEVSHQLAEQTFPV